MQWRCLSDELHNHALHQPANKLQQHDNDDAFPG
jgi:hypothetical protein